MSGRFAEPDWLQVPGANVGAAPLAFGAKGLEGGLLDRITTQADLESQQRIHLAGVGICREWYGGGNAVRRGRSTLGSRLENLGLRGKRARFRAVLLHLDHDRPYKTKESVQKNKGIRRRIVSQGETGPETAWRSSWPDGPPEDFSSSDPDGKKELNPFGTRVSGRDARPFPLGGQ